MSNETDNSCGRAELLREYAFDELAPSDKAAFRYHLESCDECSLELDRLRLTTAALRVIPDREIPQRIAFVSESVRKVSWLAAFWNSGARLGFASACVLAVAIVVFAFHQPAPTQTVAQSGIPADDVSKQVNEAVARAVAQVRLEVKAEDARTLQAALETADRKHEQEHRALMVAMDENMTNLQKRLNTFTVLASTDMGRSDMGRTAGGQ